MKLIWVFVFGVTLGGALVLPILGAGPASACHYTSQDRAKGYKC